MASEPRETELYSFGPMSVGICFSRPGFLTAVAKNMTRVVLTNKRIYGVPQGPFFKGKARFHVPYDSIISIEQFSLHINKVLWIQYREAEKTREVSIICYGLNSQHASQAYELLGKIIHKP
jgi:hypothetical protein